MRKIAKTSFAVLSAIAIAATLSLTFTGCNTVEGAGRDIGAAGEGISEGAREVRDDM